MSKLICSYRDYGKPGEVGTVVFTGVDLTAANIVAQTADADALRLAAQALMLGGIDHRQMVAWENKTKVAPTDPFAQREIKWLVRYHDTSTTKQFSLELPTADLAYLDPDSTDKINMTHVDVVAFINAFEAFQITPDGNAAVVDEILFVGRKS